MEPLPPGGSPPPMPPAPPAPPAGGPPGAPPWPPPAWPPPGVQPGMPYPQYAYPPPAWVEPVSAGRLIERTFGVWKANVFRFAALWLLVLLPIALLGVVAAIVIPNVVARGKASGPPVGLIVAGILLVVLIVVPVVVAQVGGLTFGALQHLAGRRVTVGGMMGQGFRRVGPILLAGLLAGLACLGGYLLLIVPGIMLATATCLVIPAVMIERLGPVQAFQRSLDLTRGARWPLFGAFLAMLGIQLGVSLVANVVTALVPVLGAVLSVASSVLLSSLPYILTAVAYHDLRVAKEGFDTSTLTKVFE